MSNHLNHCRYTLFSTVGFSGGWRYIRCHEDHFKTPQYHCWRCCDINVHAHWCIGKPPQLPVLSFSGQLCRLCDWSRIDKSIDPPRPAKGFPPICSRTFSSLGMSLSNPGWIKRWGVCGRWAERFCHSPSTNRKKPLGFFWRMRMAFSVVSTMDGSIFGSLSASKRRSPGSNRAGQKERDGWKKKCNNHVFSCESTVHSISPQWVEAQHRGKSHLPPTTTTIFSTQVVINHSAGRESKVSAAARKSRKSLKTVFLRVVHTITHHEEQTELTDIMKADIKSKAHFRSSERQKQSKKRV